jgi:nucleoside-diphosphate-sugar epimerase
LYAIPHCMIVLITGASGFIGGAVAEQLVDRAEVRGLTSHPGKNRFGDRVRSFAYDFDDERRNQGSDTRVSLRRIAAQTRRRFRGLARAA